MGEVFIAGNHLLSTTCVGLSLAQACFTTEFGMGSGMTTLEMPPWQFVNLKFVNLQITRGHFRVYGLWRKLNFGKGKTRKAPTK